MKLMLDQSNNFCVIFKVEFSHYLFTGLFMDIIKRSSMLINFWDLKGWEVPTFWQHGPFVIAVELLFQFMIFMYVKVLVGDVFLHLCLNL